MFGRKRNQIPDIETDYEAYKAWEDKMFPTKIHLTGHQSVSSIVEVVQQMKAEGADPLTIELLPDSVDLLLERAAKNPWIAPIDDDGNFLP